MDVFALQREIARFDPELAFTAARTPPASWYTQPAFADYERAHVFGRNWTPVARIDQVARPGAFVAGEVAREPFVVVRGEDGRLRAFANVCRHRAAPVADGEGCAQELVCPHHGWTYALDGALKRAPHLGPVEDFDPRRSGLPSYEVAEWGPLVFLRLTGGRPGLGEVLSGLDAFLDPRDCARLRWRCRRTHELACNWKVSVDNFLDGGYHVAHRHRGPAQDLDVGSGRTEVGDRWAVQHVRTGPSGGGGGARSGQEAVYAWLHPGFILNRHGPVLETNLVLPAGPDRCLVILDFWFEPGEGPEFERFVEHSLAESHRIHEVDARICEALQRGLASAAFERGPYAAPETAAHRFHQLLARDLRPAALPGV